MKKILGLDLGTNSIGWALLNSEIEHPSKQMNIEMAGSRIIPMDAALLGDFDKGNSISQTAEKTRLHSVRLMRERHLLRRERLHRILELLGFLPEHYRNEIDFEKNPGKFLADAEPKLPWRKDETGTPAFLFQASFQEMLSEFAKFQPALVTEGRKVPYDWTIYYLRKKALTEPVGKEELAWILLNFNQKRGYYQLRGEEEDENPGKWVEYCPLKVVAVEATKEKKGKDTWYNVHLENGWVYRRSSPVPLNWEGQMKDFIVTTEVNPDGSLRLDTYGEVKRSFRAPKEDDWMLIKKRTETDVMKSGKTVGCYIYDTLLQNPEQKIIGKLVKTVERKFYKTELRQILEAQTAFHAELRDRQVYQRCIEALYPANETHRRNIAGRDFVYLLMEDILFYQRPLKSKKTLIDNCPYESYAYVDKTSGEIKKASSKCIAKSHPLYQEFRLWQFLSNVRIYQKEKKEEGVLRTDVDVTGEYLPSEEAYAALFDWLNQRKEIDQKTFLKYPPFGFKKEAANFRWNYVEDRKYPCNETRYALASRLKKTGVCDDFLSRRTEEWLWHILYSVSDREEIEKALDTFAAKHALGSEFVEAFKKCPPFEKEYGAYSAKAIKKLLPLIRRGCHWKAEGVEEPTRKRIESLLRGEGYENMPDKVKARIRSFSDLSCFQGLPVWLACYVVYGRHSEAKEVTKWKTPEELAAYLASFKQHSLKNPIVEQVITETLRVVRDVWKAAGSIDEIHVELGREMKNPAPVRARMSAQMMANETANLRIKALLAEFVNPEYEIENVRPYSPGQQEILRIYEDAVLTGEDEVAEDIELILKKFKESKQPSKSEFMRYKMWLEQKYRSPYTGELIPLGKLFTPAYEIEHIIPQSRYFDDSFSNKVICESAVNKLKDNQLGYEFIKRHHGQIVETGFGGKVKIFSVEAYEEFVREQYAKSREKMKKLLMDDIPEQFIARQLNDSRYISKVIMKLLSAVVRVEDGQGSYEPEAVSKHVVVCTGSVTDRLKKEWGMNDVWNSLVYPRFERLNTLTQSQCFGHWENKGGKRVFQTEVPLEYQKGFNKKRIDHRHHAMDAIVIACATRRHVNYLNNEAASLKAEIPRQELQKLLCDKVKTDGNGNYRWVLRKPWATFTEDAKGVLEDIVASPKKNIRVINKMTNRYQHIDAEGKRVYKKQTKGDSWAIRKPMHKDTIFGKVNLRRVKEVRLAVALDTPSRLVDKKMKAKVFQLLAEQYDTKRIVQYFKENACLWKELNLAKIPVYYFTDESSEPLVAVRKPLDATFNEKKIKETVTDTGIQQILLNHLRSKNGEASLAFSPEGIEEMNRNRVALNGGKAHAPIYKVRVCEPLGNKFAVGFRGNKGSKYVVAAKGTNLFFAVYGTEEGKRTYETVPLTIVIEREKQRLPPVSEKNEAGDELLFSLSPNDLVYVPTEEELEVGRIQEPMDRGRVYKMVSCTGNEAHFVPANVANPIVQAIELGSNNKAQRAWTQEMIKEVCWPIKVDRLGRMVSLYNR